MKQFIASQMPDAQGCIKLSGKDYHYLVEVRRMREGGVVSAVLPSGEKAALVVHSIAPKHIVFKIKEPLPVEESAAPQPPVILFQAFPQGAKMDLVVRQAAECGVTEIIPFIAQRSARRRGADTARLERWRRIIREARQQSGSQTATAIRLPVDRAALFSIWEALKAAYGGEESLGLIAHTALEHYPLHGYLKQHIKLIVVAVGPEGGFSSEEAAEFISGGFKPFSLGDTILRTETAALCAVFAVRILLLEKESWIHAAKE